MKVEVTSRSFLPSGHPSARAFPYHENFAYAPTPYQHLTWYSHSHGMRVLSMGCSCTRQRKCLLDNSGYEPGGLRICQQHFTLACMLAHLKTSAMHHRFNCEQLASNSQAFASLAPVWKAAGHSLETFTLVSSDWNLQACRYPRGTPLCTVNS